MVEGLDNILRKAFKLQMEARMEARMSRLQTAQTPSLMDSSDGSYKSAQTLPRVSEVSNLNRGPRINLTQKTDLVLREIDDIQVRYEKFIKKAKKSKFNIRAEMEDIEIRAVEVEADRKFFEKAIIWNNNTNKLHRKVPAEKFVRCMQDWHNAAHNVLEKLRLHTISSKVQLTKLRKQYAEKAELSEKVDAVDLERMQIEKIHLLSELKQKNTNLVQLKRINGKASLLLTTNKKYLDLQNDKIKRIKQNLEDMQLKKAELITEAEMSELEVEQERKKLCELRSLSDNYRVPPILNYVRRKAELYDLEKQLKILRRRAAIQDSGLSTYTNMMLHITGQRMPRESWYTRVYVQAEMLKMDDINDDDYDVPSIDFYPNAINNEG